jgi:ABC-2 type transport system permease protein
VRWLLLKDLRILSRSPLLVALLVLYPLIIALLVGAALSSGPSKPKVAFANLVPREEARINVGGRQLDATTYASELFDKVEPIRVGSRAEAIEKVRSGEALGALVIPPDVIERLQGTLALGGREPPTVEVYYSAENPLKRRYVQSTINATLADANKALSDEIFKEAARYLNLIVVGGSLSLPVIGDVDILGLRNARTIIDGAIARLPPDSSSRAALAQVSRFARLAADNLDVSKPILASIGSPVAVKETAISGSQSSLDVFGVEVAVVISLMNVALLLAAGMLALEREENAFGRLVRGLV